MLVARNTLAVFLCLIANVDVQASAPQQPAIDVIRQVLKGDPAFELVRKIGQRTQESDKAVREAVLEGREMTEAMAWLSDYFNVQSDYSQDELLQFVDRVGQMSSGELVILLTKLKEERSRMQQNMAIHSRRNERSVRRLRSQRPSSTGHRSSLGGFSYRGYDHKRHYRGVLDRGGVRRRFGRRR